jgi:hypothetical protein
MTIDIKEMSKKLISLGFDEKFFKTPLKMLSDVMNQEIDKFKSACVSAHSCLDFLNEKHIASEELNKKKEELNDIVKNKFKSLTLSAVYDFYNQEIKAVVDKRNLVVEDLKKLPCADKAKIADVDTEVEKATEYASIASFVETYGTDTTSEIERRASDLDSAIVDLVDSCNKSSTNLVRDLKKSEGSVQQVVVEAANNIVILKNLLDSKTEVEVILESKDKLKSIYELIEQSSKNRAALETKRAEELQEIFRTEVEEIKNHFDDIPLRNGKKFSDIKDPKITLEHVFRGNKIKSHKKEAASDLVKAFKRFDESTLDKFFQCRKDSDFKECVNNIYKKDFRENSQKCHPDHVTANKGFCAKLASSFPGADINDIVKHISSEKDTVDAAASSHWMADELHDQYNGIYKCLGHHAHQLSGDEFWIWAKDFGCL